MKRTWLMVAAIAALAVGCKDSKDSSGAAASASVAATAAAAGSATGVSSATGASADACSNYIAALDACIAKLPAEQAGGLISTRDAQKKALADAPAVAKEQLQQGCVTGLASIKQNPVCK